MLQIGDEVEVNVEEPDNVRYFETRSKPLTGWFVVHMESRGSIVGLARELGGIRQFGCYASRVIAVNNPW